MSLPRLRFQEFSGDWEVKILGEIIKLVSGYPFSSELFTKEGKKLVIPKNFTQNGYGNFSNEYLKFTSEECDNKYISKSGDLLLLLTDLTQNCELLGKPLLLKIDDGEVLLNQRIIRIENEGTLHKVFLMNFFLTENYHKKIKETASGTTVKHSSNKIIANLHLTLPSLPEQTKIANFLTAVDEKISLLTQKADLLSQYKKGVMQQIFSQELRFKDDDGQEFPEWEEKALGEIAKFMNGKGHESIISEQGRFIVVNSKFIASNGLVFKTSKQALTPIEKDSIVMVMSDVPNGKALAKCFYIKESDKYTLNQRICSLKSDKNDNKFLYYVINRNPYFIALIVELDRLILKKMKYFHVQ